ncbi:poly(A) polymerase, partial [Clonorchis sinensis]
MENPEEKLGDRKLDAAGDKSVVHQLNQSRVERAKMRTCVGKLVLTHCERHRMKSEHMQITQRRTWQQCKRLGRVKLERPGVNSWSDYHTVLIPELQPPTDVVWLHSHSGATGSIGQKFVSRNGAKPGKPIGEQSDQEQQDHDVPTMVLRYLYRKKLYSPEKHFVRTPPTCRHGQKPAHRETKFEVLLHYWVGPNPNPMLTGEPIDVVDRFVHPGSFIRPGGWAADEITSRIGNPEPNADTYGADMISVCLSKLRRALRVDLRAMQRTINNTTKVEKVQDVFSYIGNVTVYGETSAEHDRDFRHSFDVAKTYNITLDDTRSSFTTEEVTHLAYKVSKANGKSQQRTLDEDFLPSIHRSANDVSFHTWLALSELILLKRDDRSLKYDLLVEEVELVSCNPHYAHVVRPDDINAKRLWRERTRTAGRFKNQRVFVVSAYAPSDCSSNAEKDTLYRDVSGLIRHATLRIPHFVTVSVFVIIIIKDSNISVDTDASLPYNHKVRLVSYSYTIKEVIKALKRSFTSGPEATAVSFGVWSVIFSSTIIIIDSMTSVFNIDASLPYNHGLFESLIVKKRIKMDGEWTYCCLTTIIPRCIHLQTLIQAIWIETDNKIATDIGLYASSRVRVKRRFTGEDECEDSGFICRPAWYEEHCGCYMHTIRQRIRRRKSIKRQVVKSLRKDRELWSISKAQEMGKWGLNSFAKTPAGKMRRTLRRTLQPASYNTVTGNSACGPMEWKPQSPVCIGPSSKKVENPKNLVDAMWTGEKASAEWGRLIVIPVSKKCTRTLCEDDRVISLYAVFAADDDGIDFIWVANIPGEFLRHAYRYTAMRSMLCKIKGMLRPQLPRWRCFCVGTWFYLSVILLSVTVTKFLLFLLMSSKPGDEIPPQCLGETGALSFKKPTEQDLKDSQELETTLAQLDIFETPEEITQRREALMRLQEISNKWIKQKAVEQNLPPHVAKATTGKIFTFGSYRLGVNFKGADVDSLLVVPRFITRQEFFSEFQSVLSENPHVEDIHAVVDAFVPVLKLKFMGVEIDLLFAQIDQMNIAENFNLCENTEVLMRNMDEHDVRSINGVRVNEDILNLVYNKNSFKVALKVIRFWAKRRNIYSNTLGFLGGVSWAILVSRICQLYPYASPSMLVYLFFKIFSQWPWPKPVRLRESEYIPSLCLPVWDPRLNLMDQYHLMPILTPSYPSQNSAYNVQRSNRIILERELKQ